MVLAGVVVALTLVGLASSARAAAANGVHFDPDSPAGKEYALPLDQARGEATGDESNGGSGVRAPLFGAGVSPPGSASSPAPRPRGEKDGRPASGRRGHTAPRGAAASPAAIVRIAEGGDGYPLTSGALLVAAVVLGGGALGLVLRALRRHPVSP